MKEQRPRIRGLTEFLGDKPSPYVCLFVFPHNGGMWAKAQNRMIQRLAKDLASVLL